MIELGRRSAFLCALALSAAACSSSSHTGDETTGDGGGSGDASAGPHDGSVTTFPDGAVIGDPDGGLVLLPDGAVIAPDGGIVVVLPDGAVITPDDGGVVVLPDGAVIGPDGGTTGVVGTPCHSDDECPGLFCSPSGSGFGYCSWVCNDAMPCPGDSVCARFMMGATYGYCMPRCDPHAPVCAMGFLCEPGIAEAPVCYPGCTTDADCSGGDHCGMGSSGVRQCYSPTAAIGDACATTDACPMAGYCLDEASWGTPSGTCVTFCELGSGAGCTTDSTCVAWGFMSGYGACVPTCDDTHPCRAGYSCTPTSSTGPSACVARCTDSSECTGGRTCSFVTGRCG